VESASGWQTVTFATPVAIAANTTYVASYHTNGGHYGVTNDYFAAAGVNSPPLHALQDNVDGPSGVYRYGPGTRSRLRVTAPPTTGSMYCSPHRRERCPRR